MTCGEARLCVGGVEECIGGAGRGEVYSSVNELCRPSGRQFNILKVKNERNAMQFLQVLFMCRMLSSKTFMYILQ